MKELSNEDFMQGYSAETIGLLYTLVEDAVTNHKPINMLEISDFLHAEDFFMNGRGPTGLMFQFRCLKWVRGNKAYNLLIQPQVRLSNSIPDIVWIPVITYTEEGHFSSGDLSMIKKENRVL